MGNDFREVTEEWVFVPNGLERRSRKTALGLIPTDVGHRLAQHRSAGVFWNGDSSCPAV